MTLPCRIDACRQPRQLGLKVKHARLLTFDGPRQLPLPRLLLRGTGLLNRRTLHQCKQGHQAQPQDGHETHHIRLQGIGVTPRGAGSGRIAHTAAAPDHGSSSNSPAAGAGLPARQPRDSLISHSSCSTRAA